MSRVALLDVNVLIALCDADHVHHDLAHDWFAEEGAVAWATCPITESGFLRVLSNPAYHGAGLRSAALVSLLGRMCAGPGHRFWDGAVSLRDRAFFDFSHVGSHRQITDVYLLGLAKKWRGCLATFDRTIPLKAVVGATADLLQVIEP